MKLADIILAFVHINPGISGYSLGNLDKSGMGYYFRAQHSQIYPILNELEDDGFVRSELEQSAGERNRRSYFITDDGRSYLRTQLRMPYKPKFQQTDFRKQYLRLLFLSSFDDEDATGFLVSWHAELIQTRRVVNKQITDNEHEFLGTNLTEQQSIIFRAQADFTVADLDRKIELIELTLEKLKQTRP